MSSEQVRLSQLYREHSGFVARVAQRLLARDSDVDDVVQDVFLELMKQFRSLAEQQNLRGWLTTVAVRVACKRLRRRRLLSRFGLGGGVDYELLATSEASPEERAVLGRLYRTLDRLPVELRVAWSLRYIHGERLDAVAQHCDCSLATAKRRIARAAEVIEELNHD